MAKYKYILHFSDGRDLDSEDYGDIYDSYEAAQDAALEAIGGYRMGGETLHLSNPGDYDECEDEDIDYDILEI